MPVPRRAEGAMPVGGCVLGWVATNAPNCWICDEIVPIPIVYPLAGGRAEVGGDEPSERVPGGTHGG